MTEVIVKSNNKTERNVANSIMRQALNRERKLLQAALQRTQENLQQFEKRYNMDSANFFGLFQTGKTDDRNDYIDWAGEYQIFQSIRNKLECAKELVICK